MKNSGNPAKRNAKPKAILWSSNSPWAATGYGQQTAQVVQRLAKAGHSVAVASNYGLEGTVQEWNGIKQFPRGFDIYSNDVIPAHMAAWTHENPDLDPLLITLFDVWVFKGKQWDMVDNIASWVPIDHQPAPPDVLKWCARPNVTPIAMSRFGEQMLADAGIDSTYIPHAIDTKTFKPTTGVKLRDGEVPARTFMEVPTDAFVVGMNSANKGGQHGYNRKAFPEAFLAFGMWCKKRTDAVLYVHTESKGAMGGIDLRELAKACGIPDDRIVFVDQYAHRLGIPNEVLASIYTAMDVLLQPSLGEGFGIPAIEAQSCGTPVIVSNATAQPELVGDGWLVDGQPVWDHSQKAWWFTPAVGSIINALEEAYLRGRKDPCAREFAKDYDADVVFRKYWVPFIDGFGLSERTQPVTFGETTSADPLLTIYIPTYRRPELAALLDSLGPQVTPLVEVIVSDNDGSARELVESLTWFASVTYEQQPENIGGDANIIRGFTQGRAPWVWVIGDDDTLTTGAIADVMQAIQTTKADRLILLSQAAPKAAAGFVGTLAELSKVDAALPLAATLISANVLRRSACNVELAQEKIATKYGHAWGYPSNVEVLKRPVLARVGYEHAGQGWPADLDGAKVKTDYLESVGVDANAALSGWNYMGAQHAWENQ